jgi:sugar lactone lactonase YvrE
MNARSLAVIAFVALLFGCGGGFRPSASTSSVASTSGLAPADFAPIGVQHVFWTLFAGAAYPQVEIASVPLKTTSKVTDVYNSGQNDLIYSSGMAVDKSGRLWVLSFGKYNGAPTSALVFGLPLTAKSVPRYTFVLSTTSGADALAFDPSGNLWVTSPGYHTALEYKGPFKKSGTLKPAITLPGGSANDFGIAVDKSANIYISNNNSSGKDSIAVVKPPYTHKPYYLNGLSAPGGLIFDTHGNLYASTVGSKPAVVRYNSNDLKSGAKPSIVDPTGLPSGSYEAAFAFTARGDLYAANCGSTSAVGIDVWPLSKKQFSSKLAPSVKYTNGNLQLVGCAWGIAIK